MIEPQLEAERICPHCASSHAGPTAFCCSGCEAVYGFLHAQGLGHFYELRGVRFSKPQPVGERKSFSDLAGLESSSMRFYLEGIHCLGCLWVLERLPELCPGVISAKLDIATSVIDVRISDQTNFTSVADTIQRLGYRPHAIRKDAAEFATKENRTYLSRLGVAAAGTGNIMLLSVSIYAGADNTLARNFAWITLGLALPVLTYSAWPIYQSALGSFRSRSLSIDLPIALAILAGIAASVASLLKGGVDVYFDSLSMLVFLLLGSRYLLRRLQSFQLRHSTLFDFVETQEVEKVVGEKTEIISLTKLSPGDRIWIREDSTLPCDGIVRSEGALLDRSLLSGESLPEEVRSGEDAYAGTKNLGKGFALECTRLGKETRLGQILDQLESPALSRTPLAGVAEQVAKYFVTIVIAVAALTIFLHLGNFEEGIRRALTLVIVTCPCVFAFSVPLAMALSSRKATKLGILIRNPESIERLPGLDTLYLDKTGTITKGTFRVISWTIDSGSREEILSAVYSLESKSRHPVARALTRDLENKSRLVEVNNFTEVPGRGVGGRALGSDWELMQDRSATHELNSVKILRDGALVGRVLLGDELRPQTREALAGLGSRNIFLLTGDRKEIADTVGESIGLPRNRIYAGLSPEEKAQIVARSPRSLMVGDGANDALAFRAASIGIACHGSAELCLKNADIFLSRPGLETLGQLLRIADDTRSVIIRNLFFSVGYNIIAGYWAFTGAMSPLWAAVLMPLSATTVFLSTAWGLGGNKQ